MQLHLILISAALFSLPMSQYSSKTNDSIFDAGVVGVFLKGEWLTPIVPCDVTYNARDVTYCARDWSPDLSRPQAAGARQVYSNNIDHRMSKRTRKVAFSEEVELAEKKRRGEHEDEQLEADRSESWWALIGNMPVGLGMMSLRYICS